MKSHHVKSALLVLGMSVAGSGFAQKAGDTIVGFGWAFINPNGSLGSATSTGGQSAPVFTSALIGSSASINSANTPSFSVLRMLTDNVGAELSLGLPPKLTVNIKAPNNPLLETSINNAATAKALTPALVVKYFFMSPANAFRPYLGIGLTHANFSSVTPNTSSQTVLDLASTSATLGSSWAPVYNAGLIYNINDKWSINGSVSYIPLSTNVTFVGPGAGGGSVTTTTKLTINPTDYVIRIGYKF